MQFNRRLEKKTVLSAKFPSWEKNMRASVRN